MAIQIALDNLTNNNLGLFNIITAPVEYSEDNIKSFKEAGDLCQYAYFSEVPVGVVVSKSLKPSNAKAPIGLVITVLQVLEAYSENYGIEKKMIDYIEELTTKRHVEKTFIVLNKKGSNLIKLAHDLGYVEEDANKDLYKGLSLVGQSEILLVKDLE